VNTRLRLFAVLATNLLAQANLFAWSGAGHMVIAAEAWRELSPAQKANATLLLKSHSPAALVIWFFGGLWVVGCR
jgi:hypothetical protein